MMMGHRYEFFDWPLEKQRDHYPYLAPVMKSRLHDAEPKYMMDFCDDLVLDIRTERAEQPKAKVISRRKPERIEKRNREHRVRTHKRWAQANWHLLGEPLDWSPELQEAVEQIIRERVTVPTKLQYIEMYGYNEYKRHMGWKKDG